MGLQYGKEATPRRSYVKKTTKAAGPVKKTENFKVKFNGRGSIEDFSQALQMALAELQQMGVHAIQNCAVYLAPLNAKGARIDVVDEHGEVLEVLEIELPEEAAKSNPGVKRLVFPGSDPKKAA